MKTLTSRQVSPFYNTFIGRTDNTRPAQLVDEDIQRGELRRRIEAIEAMRERQRELREVWE